MAGTFDNTRGNQLIKPQRDHDIYCSACGKTKASRNFYKSNHKIYDNDKQHGRFPICKECIKRQVYIKNTGEIDKVSFKDMLQKLDMPFFDELYIKALMSDKETFGTYLTLLNLFYKNREGLLSWEDGEIGTKVQAKAPTLNTKTEAKKTSSFKVDQEIVDKWGIGYQAEEYEVFEKKWNSLIDNYGEKTSFHNENLKTYIRFRVKEEMATALGNVKEAKEWAMMAKDAATAAKINVSQLSKSDISGGVDLVCQIFEMAETEQGIIPLLPKLLEQPYDDADMIIWAVINYGRRLEGKPRVEYRDIWSFYDNMLEEYFTQQGYNEEQVKEFKERRNNVFRNMEEVYIEPVYEDKE